MPMNPPPPTNRPDRGASPAQDVDTARRYAEQAANPGPDDQPAVHATLAVAYTQLAQASLLSALLREARRNNDLLEDDDGR